MKLRGRTWGILALVAVLSNGCDDAEKGPGAAPHAAPPPTTPTETPAVAVSPATLPPVSEGGSIELAAGARIHLVTIGGKRYVPIEATLSEAGWQSLVFGVAKAERAVRVEGEMARIVGVLRQHTTVVGVRTRPSIGWFSALVPLDAYATLGFVTGLDRQLLVNPRVSTEAGRGERRGTMGAGKNAVPTGASGLASLGGLERLGVPKFLATLQAELGVRPDGANVAIGVVDTGITYAHPAFHDAAGTTRIDVMKDFTGEGRIFFTSAGRFQLAPVPNAAGVGVVDKTFALTADVLVAPTGNNEDPDPDALEAVERTIVVGPELAALLSAPGASGARYGVFSEAAIEGNDLNQNGKTDDLLGAILVPGSAGAPDRVWFDAAGSGDFRKAGPVTSFEISKATMTTALERFGLEIKRDKLIATTGTEVAVTTAALVGFDPGNHGTHVAGIAAARKMLSNAPDDTDLRGVAPAARIRSGRICANSGGCGATEAIIDLSDGGADVINMSIGSLPTRNDGYGVQEAIINRLTMANGTLFMISAGNEGPGRQTVGSPSVARLAMSVAATATPSLVQQQYAYPGWGKPSASLDQDYLLYFSSRGPTAAGGMKPDLSAPGTWLSAVQLNAAPGAASGLDVMWGTSMASPAAAGAVALLLDAARRYNAVHPSEPLATDASTLRRVLLHSARPFDVTSLDVATGATTLGDYTFADEGFGMIDLPTAWSLLVEERKSRGATGVGYLDADGNVHDVRLDWDVRVLRTNPNGLAYDGSQSAPGPDGSVEPRLGRGLWIDDKSDESLFRVQFGRRLPASVASRPDAAALATQLKTSADELAIETVVHGSHVPWLRAGGLLGVDCSVAPSSLASPHVLVVGEGAIDVPVDPKTGKGGSYAAAASTLPICVDRGLVATLAPGDHGALVKAYRVVGGVREAAPTVVVPVYLNVPDRTLAGAAGYHVTGEVASFGVARHYVEIPKGTSLVKVKLAVPPAKSVGKATSECSGVSLEALEGKNSAIPPEFVSAPSDAIAQSCTSSGKVAPAGWREVKYTRVAPTPGMWDLHVFGMYGFARSPFTLDVEYANLVASKSILDGPPSVLAGTFDVDILDASFAIAVSAAKSTLSLFELSRTSSAVAEEGKRLRVPDATGAVARAYPASAAKVTLSIVASTAATKNDLDLEVFECTDAAATDCTSIGTSAGPSDEESITFVPKAAHFYVAEVNGYAVKGAGDFVLREAETTAKPESGVLTLAAPTPSKFTFTTSFDVAASTLLADPRFTSGAFAVDGEIVVRDDDGTALVRVPIHVH